MSGLNLEELETSALAKRDTQAASIAKLVDASLDAARLLDKELTPFRKYLHRPAFDIKKNTHGLDLELVIHNMTLRLRLETSSDGLSAQSHPLRCITAPCRSEAIWKSLAMPSQMPSGRLTGASCGQSLPR